MHAEKNICESVLGTLLKLEGKTKDHVKARLDLTELGIRKELHLVPRGDKFDVPAASYTLYPAERKVFCEWLKMVKFPDGYASNISRCVNTKDDKVSGPKSHDCHVLLQRVLPVALRGFLSSDISLAIIELGIFFRELCCKTLNLKALKKMEKDITVILCKLEHIFPPSFFDIMVHLAVHLPHEAILGGPVQYRWMYPIERFLCKLKRYVRNKAQPEGSIAEAYVDAECLTFCSMYLQDIETQFNREDRNYGGGQVDEQYETFDVFSQNVRPLGKPKIVPLSKDDLHKIQYYVLNNSEEISPYLDKHLKEVDGSVTMQAQLFPIWFQEHIEELKRNGSSEATKDLYSLAIGPDFRVKRYYGCVVNGMRFHTKDHEVYLRTQNSGVVVEGEHQSNLIDFFGVVTDIIELDYLYGNKVYLFKCDWWDVGNKRTGIQTDGLFVSVNVNKRWYENDSFVLAMQVAQVFYLNDTKLGGSWQVVQKIAPRNVYDVLEKERDVGVEHSDVAYQEEELDANDVPVGNVRIGKLSREDVIPDEVDANIVMINNEDHEMRDVFIIEDGEGAEQEVEEEDEDEDEDEDEEREGGEEEQEEEGEDEEDDLDEDDDTLIEYCSEEDGITSRDSDSEID